MFNAATANHQLTNGPVKLYEPSVAIRNVLVHVSRSSVLPDSQMSTDSSDWHRKEMEVTLGT